jgi:hypothetical protein
VDEEVGAGLIDGVVDVALQGKAAILPIVPVVVASPVAVEVEVSDVVEARRGSPSFRTI